jgi:hypothetical protein
MAVSEKPPTPEQYLHAPKQGDLLQVYNASHVKEVIKNDEFEITDLMLEDVYGSTVWTTVYITLYGGGQSLFFNATRNIKYEITSGEAWFTVENKGKLVIAGDKILIYEGLAHKMYNNSKSLEFRCQFDYPGICDFRKKLGEEKFTIS